MLGGYKILTVTHRQTNLKEIGKYVIPNDDADVVKSKLEALKKAFNLDELLYLSTCNRVMYLFYTRQPLHQEFVNNFFQFVNPDLNPKEHLTAEKISAFEDKRAIQHLHEVAASIDSMVIGEREILRQLREAYEQCRQWGLTDDNLRIAMKFTVEAAKEVYAQTRIGEKPISIVSLAIHKLLAANIPKEAKILMIGAGQTNMLAAKFLKKHAYHNVAVFNRTLAKAKQVANVVSGEGFALDKIEQYQDGFDCLIACTGATKAIVTKEMYTHLLNGDTTPKVVIDLSIPNNVAKEVVSNFDVNYIEIEGLRALAEENMAFRQREITRVKELLATRLEAFQKLYQQRLIERAMRQVPDEIKSVKAKAINEIFKKELAEVDEPTRQLIETMMNYMEKQTIGATMKAAKKSIQ